MHTWDVQTTITGLLKKALNHPFAPFWFLNRFLFTIDICHIHTHDNCNSCLCVIRFDWLTLFHLFSSTHPPQLSCVPLGGLCLSFVFVLLNVHVSYRPYSVPLWLKWLTCHPEPWIKSQRSTMNILFPLPMCNVNAVWMGYKWHSLLISSNSIVSIINIIHSALDLTSWHDKWEKLWCIISTTSPPCWCQIVCVFRTDRLATMALLNWKNTIIYSSLNTTHTHTHTHTRDCSGWFAVRCVFVMTTNISTLFPPCSVCYSTIMWCSLG